MSLLSKVTKGVRSAPDFILVHGTDGVGKTTLASQAPNCLIVGPESGSDHLDVERLEVRTWEEMMAAIKELAATQHAFGSVAFDSLDWIEALLFQHICEKGGVENIEKYDGGYGKGYTEARRLWGDFVAKLQTLRNSRGVNIILIAHSQIKAFTDPQANVAYDRYQLKLNDKSAAFLREAVDCVFFANYKTHTKEEKGKQKAKAFGDGSRVLYTERRPAFDAKNRFNLPFEIEFDHQNGWAAFQKAKAEARPENPEDLRRDIDQLLTMIPASDAQIREAVQKHLAQVGNDVRGLVATRTRLRELTGQK